MNGKKIELPAKFLNEISEFENIYIELSGGYNSSVSVLLFHELGFKRVFLIHNDTKLQYIECSENIQKLIEITNYPLIVKAPNLRGKRISEVMKESFQNISLARENIKQYRDYFSCCRILKSHNSVKWVKDVLLDNKVIISSLTPYESFNRQMRLFELKKLDTYIRFHKTQHCYKGYPYRDLLKGNRRFSRKIFDVLFENKMNEYDLNIKHSGCRICPIRVLFPDMLTKNDCSIKYGKIFSR